MRVFGDQATRFHHQGIIAQDTGRSGSHFYQGGNASGTPAGPSPTYVVSGMLRRPRGDQRWMGLLRLVWSPTRSKSYGWVPHFQYLRYVRVAAFLLLVAPLFMLVTECKSLPREEDGQSL